LAAVTTRVARGAAAVLISGALLTACGDTKFENKPRAPIRVELTGVIRPDKVTVSPDKVGAGPVSILIANQTKADHTITLDGGSVRKQVGPIAPGDTATIASTLAPGDYEVRAGSTAAVPKEIGPAELTIGKPRGNSNDDLLLP
jgi:hypothetical protein